MSCAIRKRLAQRVQRTHLSIPGDFWKVLAGPCTAVSRSRCGIAGCAHIRGKADDARKNQGPIKGWYFGVRCMSLRVHFPPRDHARKSVARVLLLCLSAAGSHAWAA